MKSFPSQGSRALAKALEQLLNIWTAKELNVFGKCEECISPRPPGTLTRRGYRTGSLIPSHETQYRHILFAIFQSQPPTPPSSGTHRCPHGAWAHESPLPPAASVGERAPCDRKWGDSDPGGNRSSSSCSRDEPEGRRKKNQKILPCESVSFLPFGSTLWPETSLYIVSSKAVR